MYTFIYKLINNWYRISYPKFSKWCIKYGNFLPLLTSSQADITLFVKGLGPQLNTPILLT